jgi:predicted murein hydrolase (TIGR00659 family)
MRDLKDIWVYLAASPLLHLALTLVAYRIGLAIYQRANLYPLLNPVPIAVAITVGVLVATGTRYETYFEGAQFVHFLLGPATVALAIPLYRQLDAVRRSAAALAASIAAGAVTASASAVLVAWALGASHETLISLAPKSVTAPVAMGISAELGGLPSLTAVLVMMTGILGAMVGPMVMNAMGVRNWAARGLAMGTTSHGIGTARAMQVNATAGAFAGLAMGLNALVTAAVLPLVWHLWPWR